jgi:hypothetical protein
MMALIDILPPVVFIVNLLAALVSGYMFTKRNSNSWKDRSAISAVSLALSLLSFLAGALLLVKVD